jgi:DNA-binding NarL/FixJ family response regulator
MWYKILPDAYIDIRKNVKGCRLRKHLKVTEKFIAVSIVEDNHYIRKGWVAALEAVDDFIVLNEYESCEAAIADLEIGQADVVILDIGLPGMSGTEGVKALLQQHPKLAILMCTVHDDDEKIFNALSNGAIGYLLKSTPPEDFIQAIRTTAAGGSFMSPDIARKVIASFHQKDTQESFVERLDEKETRILSELSKGKPYREVAETVHLSIDGIRYRIQSIYRKLQVHTRSEAVAKGFKRRLIK